MNRSPDEMEGLEKLLESLILMVGRTNEKIDGLQKRVHQLERAAKEQQERRVYRFVAEPNRKKVKRV
ncbi:hypothetical protein M3181_06920 [Mesobacillus maritimus]|uniref:hypothetical protein n=1 Tax=Mesobacillus maritimus TaxID=1643336 RepID=UPI00203CA0E1|nr:hypothetical protein [Mesobacillus maritimus]MCM3668731.1 hypothetical protein [Mesobacillus maritimus]